MALVRPRHHPPPAGVGEEPAAQLDRVGQVKFDPPRAAVVGPLEPGVQPGAQLDDRASRMRGEELADPPVEYQRAEHGHEPAPAAAVERLVPLDGLDDFDGLGITQRWPFPLALPRPPRQRDEQRLLDVSELRPLLVGHVRPA
jgi:hypothetical protein